MTVRPFQDADWDAFWPVFRGVVADGETYAYPAGLTSDEARALWTADTVLVAESSGDLVGSAKCGPNRPGRGSHVGTASFMVAPSARGLGVGRALGLAVLDELRAQGFRAVQFNAVVETNTAAVRLWESLGFGIVGTVPAAFDSASHGLVGLHVMWRSL